ncbi:MAG TPA: tRNA (guanosine(46)-N7)-methyltransferase TrmB [Verrucomicrobiae bacterium]|nr:tRNA (guanosine(46)-N7)-methyltransferase TrmB [Verrucomicrobiae bacterium]
MRGPEPHPREIRSFVRREGRMTESQKRALEDLWPKYGVEAPAEFRGHESFLRSVFGRDAPVAMEIGFGNGDHLLARAQAEPQRDFFGVEVHRPGVGRVLNRAHAAGLSNLRVAAHDAVEVLRDWLPEASLAEVIVYFPDPWHKKRHHKRRIVQPAFAALVASRLVAGGLFKLATDWAPYAEHMRATLDVAPPFENCAGAAGFMPRPDERPLTRFEARGQRLGHDVFDLAYRRVG